MDTIEVEANRHCREYRRNDDGEANTDSVDHAFVLMRAEAQCLKCAIEAMHQVPAQRDATQYINDHHPKGLEFVVHHGIQWLFLACGQL